MKIILNYSEFNDGYQYSMLNKSSYKNLKFLQDIEDITLELSDGPFEISHMHHDNLHYLVIRKMVPEEELSTLLDSFRYSDVKSTINRLFDYLNSSIAYGVKSIDVLIADPNSGNIKEVSFYLHQKSIEDIEFDLEDKIIREIKLYYLIG